MTSEIDIRRWLRTRISQLIGCPLDEIGTSQPFEHFGIDSATIVTLSGELSDWLCTPLEPTILYEHPNIERLAFYLSALKAAPRTPNREYAPPGSIAIVGIGCRVPGAQSPEAFARMLREGLDAIGDVPPDRWNVAQLHDPTRSRAGTIVTVRGGFLSQVAGFDSAFFGVSAAEADRMDPQQRLLLEVTWEALEDAGWDSASMVGSPTGVFVGISTNDYARRQLANLEAIDGYASTGNAASIAANRISYFFDWAGPSIAVDTACSSSLVALHLACRSLRDGECSVAVVGGVNLMLGAEASVSFSSAGMLAPDGHCKTFDAQADGYVRGEGCGVAVLKPLQRALADGDRIRAVVLGSAIGHDGRTNGLTAPSPQAQETVLRTACAAANVRPIDVGYVELHGTGTLLGDPIEAKALGAVYGTGRDANHRLAVGSVKTNVGHLEAAAGITGLIKTVLALEGGFIPASLNFSKPNPYIPFESLGLRVQTECTPWRDGEPRLAGVSSFGFGGANAHVVLAGPPKHAERTRDAFDGPVLLALSAASRPALDSLAGRYRHVLAQAQASGQPRLDDLCLTTGVGRSHHRFRLAVAGNSSQHVLRRLDAFLEGRTAPGLSVGEVRKDSAASKGALIWVFSGQGSQWEGMGSQLLRESPTFADALAHCDSALRKHLGWSVVEELSAGRAERLARTDAAQPLLFAIQIALAETWRAWGIEPCAVIGHSVGEIAAAHVAGILSLEDSAQLVVLRGALMQRAAGTGRMLAIEASAAEAEQLAKPSRGRVSVAAFNGPRSIVLAGDAVFLEEVRARVAQGGSFARWLGVEFPFHGPGMAELSTELERALAGLCPRAPQLAFYSTVRGTRIDDAAEFGPVYWAEGIRRPVLFQPAVEAALEEGLRTWLEIGPHPALVGSLEQIFRGASVADATAVGSMSRDGADLEQLSATLTQLYTRGVNPRWAALWPQARRTFELPTYPWSRRTHWIETASTSVARRPGHPLLQVRTELAGSSESVWSGSLDLQAFPSLADHRVGSRIILPAAAYLEIALSAAVEHGLPLPLDVQDCQFHAPIELQEGHVPELQLRGEADADGSLFLRFYVRASAMQSWALHAVARVRTASGAAETIALDAIRGRCSERIPVGAVYDALDRRGLNYGSSFRVLGDVWRGQGEALASIDALVCGKAEGCFFHPALLDGAFQCVSAAVDAEVGGTEQFVPASVGRLRVFAERLQPSSVHVTIGEFFASEGRARFDLELLASDGQVVIKVEGLELARSAPALKRATSGFVPNEYEMQWRPVAPVVAGRVDEPGRWLLLGDDQGLAERLSEQLRARGEVCTVVAAGLFATSAVKTQGGLQAIVHEWLRSADSPPARGVIHLCALDADAAAAGTSIPEIERRCCSSVVETVQGIAWANPLKFPSLWLVSRGAQGDSPQNPTQALLWGIGRVVAIEHPELTCRRVDLDAREELAEELLATQFLAPDGEDQVLLRGSGSLLKRLAARVTPRLPSRCPLKPLRFRQDSTYVITGAFGALGGLLAHWMVQRGVRNLALFGRHPQRPEAIKLRRELEAAGCRVWAQQPTDVGDRHSLEPALLSVQQLMPSVRGIFHLAGILDDAAVVDSGRDGISRVLAPKFLGAIHLEQLLGESELDYFVLFSSAAGVLGSPGQAAYAAANASLDALAARRRAAGKHALAIAWGPWAEHGMGAEAFKSSSLGSAISQLPPESGLEVLERLLCEDATHAVVLPLDLTNLVQFYPVGASIAIFSELLGNRTGELRSVGASTRLGDRPELDREYIAPRSEAERRVAAIWQRALGIARIGVRDEFFELGGDSVFANQIVVQVNQAFGVALDPEKVFEQFTIERVAELANFELATLAEHMTDDEAEALLRSGHAERPETPSHEDPTALPVCRAGHGIGT